jgi:phospholipase C
LSKLIDVDFFSDCKGNPLPAYSFLEPRYAHSEDPSRNTFFSASDQHPDHNVEQGEILIRDVFNAIWSNQPLRESTLLVVVYDEHGREAVLEKPTVALRGIFP